MPKKSQELKKIISHGHNLKDFHKWTLENKNEDEIIQIKELAKQRLAGLCKPLYILNHIYHDCKANGLDINKIVFGTLRPKEHAKLYGNISESFGGCTYAYAKSISYLDENNFYMASTILNSAAEVIENNPNISNIKYCKEIVSCMQAVSKKLGNKHGAIYNDATTLYNTLNNKYNKLLNFLPKANILEDYKNKIKVLLTNIPSNLKNSRRDLDDKEHNKNISSNIDTAKQIANMITRVDKASNLFNVAKNHNKNIMFTKMFDKYREEPDGKKNEEKELKEKQLLKENILGNKKKWDKSVGTLLLKCLKAQGENEKAMRDSLEKKPTYGELKKVAKALDPEGDNIRDDKLTFKIGAKTITAHKDHQGNDPNAIYLTMMSIKVALNKIGITSKDVVVNSSNNTFKKWDCLS